MNPILRFADNFSDKFFGLLFPCQFYFPALLESEIDAQKETSKTDSLQSSGIRKDCLNRNYAVE